MKTLFSILFPILFLATSGITQEFQPGEPIDSLNGVKVFYNGGMRKVYGRNVVDGYNVGLKYQCVEFAKRYYFEYYNHRMPDSYGHAKSFYNHQIKDGEYNAQRDLLQFSNPSISQPQEGDLIVMNEVPGNPFGHVAIISQVWEDSLEIIQQNKDEREPSRMRYELTQTEDEKWKIEQKDTLGWLRKE